LEAPGGTESTKAPAPLRFANAIQTAADPGCAQLPNHADLPLLNPDFEFASSFGFRISGFGFRVSDFGRHGLVVPARRIKTK
jgi:hypothetical protein